MSYTPAAKTSAAGPPSWRIQRSLTMPANRSTTEGDDQVAMRANVMSRRSDQHIQGVYRVSC